jgi:hypothetical protein
MPKPIWKRSCQQCGAKLKLAPSGRRKRFCSDACRQAAFRNEKAAKYSSKGYENCASELIETQNDFLSRNEELELSRSSAHSSKEPILEKQNRLTYKLTDGVQINTGSGRASRALGCVTEVFPGRWMARVRNLGGDLLSFGAAKQEAVRLYRCRDKGTIDWICLLNLRVAAEINITALASNKRKTPIDLIGRERQGHVDPKIRATVLDAEIGFLMDAQQETIKGDDYLLEYDSDGYPELPACLYRRKPRP